MLSFNEVLLIVHEYVGAREEIPAEAFALKARAKPPHMGQ
jgi:hypothetical protein